MTDAQLVHLLMKTTKRLKGELKASHCGCGHKHEEGGEKGKCKGRVLKYLIGGPVAKEALAKDLGIAEDKIMEFLKKPIEHGAVEVGPDGEVSITEKGKERFTARQQQREAAVNKAFAALSTEDKEELAALLAKIDVGK